MEGIDQTVTALGWEFWDWRRTQQPRSSDDIPRITRPRGWVPDWSSDAVKGYRRFVADMEKRWRSVELADAPVATKIDHRLLGSALARVRWELDVLESWRLDPYFYVDQTLGAFFDDLLPATPFDDERVEDILARLNRADAILEAGMDNLAENARRPFAEVAIGDLRDVEKHLRSSLQELSRVLDDRWHKPLEGGIGTMISALTGFRTWLESRLDTMEPSASVGRERFREFLRDVALSPYEPEDLLRIGREAWARAVVFESVERNRNELGGVGPARVASSLEEQIERQARGEAEVRGFYEGQDLLTQPASLRRYLNKPRPGYLAPLAFLGVADDLTSMERPQDDSYSYKPEPGPSLPYFYAADAQDPRLGTIHEGVHAQQLALSWLHERPVRHHYYDSAPNEGIAFYNEELMLQAGLFDDSSRSRQVVQNFMRLRALRVEIDVGLAIGDLEIEQAAQRLERFVPMDRPTAAEEAVFFARNPGQGMSYQVGKSQLLAIMAEALTTAPERFTLRKLHDYFWKNGNVPFALQRWELLGLSDWIDAVDALRD